MDPHLHAISLSSPLEKTHYSALAPKPAPSWRINEGIQILWLMKNDFHSLLLHVSPIRRNCYAEVCFCLLPEKGVRINVLPSHDQGPFFTILAGRCFPGTIFINFRQNVVGSRAGKNFSFSLQWNFAWAKLLALADILAWIDEDCCRNDIMKFLMTSKMCE